MLKIHKPNHKLFIISITSILSICVLLGFSASTYTPNLSHAEQVSTEDAKEKRTLANITYMQDITPEICANTPEADTEGNNQYQLKDSRDQSSYRVAKLRDGNCWMTQNLRLIGGKRLTPMDSDVSENYWLSASVTISSSDDPKKFDTTDQYIARTYYADNTSYGAYYNWTAATAGIGGSSSFATDGKNATSSICPKGWKLPTGKGTSSEFYVPLDGLSSNQLISAPYYFMQSGYINKSTLNMNSAVNYGGYGYYWSSTVGGSVYAYVLRFSTGNVSLSYKGNRDEGYSIRCVTLGGEKPNNDNVEVTISNTISLDAASEVKIEKSEGNPSTANLDIKVASNQLYTVSIGSANPNLTSTNGTTIPSKSGLLNTNENAWGIKLSTASTYSQITSIPTTFYTATGAEVKTIPFTVGISTSPDLPNGEYSTDITITAAQN